MNFIHGILQNAKIQLQELLYPELYNSGYEYRNTILSYLNQIKYDNFMIIKKLIVDPIYVYNSSQITGFIFSKMDTIIPVNTFFITKTYADGPTISVLHDLLTNSLTICRNIIIKPILPSNISNYSSLANLKFNAVLYHIITQVLYDIYDKYHINLTEFGYTLCFHDLLKIE